MILLPFPECKYSHEVHCATILRADLLVTAHEGLVGHGGLRSSLCNRFLRLRIHQWWPAARRGGWGHVGLS